MVSKSEAIYPSIAIPEYNFAKSLDPFNSTARESKTLAQKTGVWSWKLKWKGISACRQTMEQKNNKSAGKFHS
jgi:hypothetical protein